MKKNEKIFGIGAAVLLLMLSIAPIAQSEDYTTDAYDMRDEILSIFESHADDLALIEAYVMEYIEEHGHYEGIVLPPELQEIADTITDEVLEAAGDAPQQQPELIQQVQELMMMQGQQQQLQQFGGITKIEGPHFYIYFLLGIRMGWYFDTWLNQNLVDSLSPFNVAISLLPYLGPYAFIIALAISIHIVFIQNTSQGNGVYFKTVIQVVPFGLVFMGDLQPQ